MPASLTFYVAEDLSDHQQRQNALIKEVVTYLRSKLLWMENDFESSVQVPSEFFKPLRHILRKSHVSNLSPSFPRGIHRALPFGITILSPPLSL